MGDLTKVLGEYTTLGIKLFVTKSHELSWALKIQNRQLVSERI